MRRSHEEITELVQARVADFINGDSTESVLRASLKALGLDEADINLEVFKARTQRTGREKQHVRR